MKPCLHVAGHVRGFWSTFQFNHLILNDLCLPSGEQPVLALSDPRNARRSRKRCTMREAINLGDEGRGGPSGETIALATERGARACRPRKNHPAEEGS